MAVRFFGCSWITRSIRFRSLWIVPNIESRSLSFEVETIATLVFSELRWCGDMNWSNGPIRKSFEWITFYLMSFFENPFAIRSGKFGHGILIVTISNPTKSNHVKERKVVVFHWWSQSSGFHIWVKWSLSAMASTNRDFKQSSYDELLLCYYDAWARIIRYSWPPSFVLWADSPPQGMIWRFINRWFGYWFQPGTNQNVCLIE